MIFLGSSAHNRASTSPVNARLERESASVSIGLTARGNTRQLLLEAGSGSRPCAEDDSVDGAVVAGWKLSLERVGQRLRSREPLVTLRPTDFFLWRWYSMRQLS